MLEHISVRFLENLLQLDVTMPWVSALHFFIYETIKISLLLLVITHLMGLVNAYFPVERVRDIIASGQFRGSEHFVASLFGAVTPFCSCSSIPLFIGFLQGGIPLGITFSFLITSPLVNEVALALFLGMFGWKVTLIYAVSGVLLGTVIGWILGILDLDAYVEEWVWNLARKNADGKKSRNVSFRKRLRYVVRDAFGIMRRIGPYVLAGIGVGAIIHGYVPTGFFEKYISDTNPIAVPLSVLLAVPMYASASGVIPVVQALVAKGIPLGTAMAFMMAVVGLSLPEAMILKKVMHWRLLVYFFGSVALSIILLGYSFNFLF